MLDHLETEGRNPASRHLDEMTPLEFVRLMNAEDGRVIDAVASQEHAIARAIEVIADRLRGGGRLVYAGAGTSGRLGVLDASECPPTFNSRPEQVVGVIAGGHQALTRAVEGAEDHPEYAERDLAELNLSPADVFVGIATSGRTPYVLGGLAYARRVGAYAIGLACASAAELRDAADLAILPVVGPEVLSGSTRLKAGTATKLVLNMLSTGAMVRLGKAFGNLMVDLRATNVKLRARTGRIVRQLTGLDVADADELMQRCGGELKTALVAHSAGLTPEAARQRLAEAGGRVRDALPPRPPADGSLAIGIDGGGTHTVALLARGGTVVGRGEAGPSNLRAVGAARATAALDEAVERAFAAAGVARGPVGSSCLGLAGAGREEEREAVLHWAGRVHLAERTAVVADAALLLAAGTPDGWGLAVVAGTGSIAWGRTADGREGRAGGWGYLLGDEGSGYAIALAALRAVVRAADGTGPATALTERLLGHLRLGGTSDVVGLVYGGGMDRAALAGLAPLVIGCADDAVAAEIVDTQARELATAAAAAARRLGFDGRPFPLALAGGVLLKCDDYRRRVLEAMAEGGLRPEPVTLVREPAEGAVRLALRT
ncbi:MAG: N-acetylmuramic acid 6-phosphate etherase [Gemmataceae bacterium]